MIQPLQASKIMNEQNIQKEKKLSSKVVDDFGSEWKKFDQSELSEKERKYLFNNYFFIFPWNKININSLGMDIGCGSGRWAKSIAPKVGHLLMVDPAKDAIETAKKNLSILNNVSFYERDANNLPTADNTLDFAYSIGVLHHIIDTESAIKKVSVKLKSKAPFLIYLYYAFDNRNLLFKLIWRISDIIRKIISRLPRPIKYLLCEIIAGLVYFPLAKTIKFLEIIGFNVSSFPLSFYRNSSYYIMRNDALDRFGTRIENRFSKKQIYSMLENANFENIVFHEKEPYWCALAYKK